MGPYLCSNISNTNLASFILSRLLPFSRSSSRIHSLLPSLARSLFSNRIQMIPKIWFQSRQTGHCALYAVFAVMHLPLLLHAFSVPLAHTCTSQISASVWPRCPVLPGCGSLVLLSRNCVDGSISARCRSVCTCFTFLFAARLQFVHFLAVAYSRCVLAPLFRY